MIIGVVTSLASAKIASRLRPNMRYTTTVSGTITSSDAPSWQA